MQNWAKNVDPKATKRLEQFVVNNINHPISVIYLQSLGKQGISARVRVNTLMKQGLGIQMGIMNKVIGAK
jgi:3-hydroxyacyl-CoA dehydrogenase